MWKHAPEGVNLTGWGYWDPHAVIVLLQTGRVPAERWNFPNFHPRIETRELSWQSQCVCVWVCVVSMLSADPSLCQNQTHKDVHWRRSHDEIMSRGGGGSQMEERRTKENVLLFYSKCATLRCTGWIIWVHLTSLAWNITCFDRKLHLFWCFLHRIQFILELRNFKSNFLADWLEPLFVGYVKIWKRFKNY